MVDFNYDLSGNLTKEIQTSGTTTLVTSHTYDQRGLLTSTTDPRGNVTGADPAAYTATSAYDELGRQIRVTAPPVAAESNGGAPQTVRPVQTFGYDTFDEQVAVKDELGNVSRAAFDRLGRQASASAPAYTPPGGTTPVTPTTLTRYDPLGNVAEIEDPRSNVTRYTHL